MFGFSNPYPHLYRVETSPLIEGRVTQYGKAMPRVKVQRRIYYGNKMPRIHNTRTDANGDFTFKPYEMATRTPGDPSREQFIGLAVHVFLGNPPKTIWESTLCDNTFYTDKLKYMLGHLHYDVDNDDGRLIDMRQGEELDSPEISLLTACDWDDMDYQVRQKKEYLS